MTCALLTLTAGDSTRYCCTLRGCREGVINVIGLGRGPLPDRRNFGGDRRRRVWSRAVERVSQPTTRHRRGGNRPVLSGCRVLTQPRPHSRSAGWNFIGGYAV